MDKSTLEDESHIDSDSDIRESSEVRSLLQGGTPHICPANGTATYMWAIKSQLTVDDATNRIGIGQSKKIRRGSHWNKEGMGIIPQDTTS
jgi:hypothetical protein